MTTMTRTYLGLTDGDMRWIYFWAGKQLDAIVAAKRKARRAA